MKVLADRAHKTRFKSEGECGITVVSAILVGDPLDVSHDVGHAALSKNIGEIQEEVEGVAVLEQSPATLVCECQVRISFALHPKMRFQNPIPALQHVGAQAAKGSEVQCGGQLHKVFGVGFQSLVVADQHTGSRFLCSGEERLDVSRRWVSQWLLNQDHTGASGLQLGGRDLQVGRRWSAHNHDVKGFTREFIRSG